jgi:hypothetical protein
MKRKAQGGDRRERRKMYRAEFTEQHKAMVSTMRRDSEEIKIKGIVIKPCSIDMETFCGTEWELEHAVERFYTNYGLYVLLRP